MASKRDVLNWFVRERCKRVFAERVAFYVRAQSWDVAKLLAREAEYLAASIGHEVGRTYSLVETDDELHLLSILDGISRLRTQLRSGIALIKKSYVSRARNEWIEMAESLLSEMGSKLRRGDDVGAEG